jgi:zinc carboxypeptidase
VIGFVDSLARRGASIRIGTLGQSPEGRRIPWVLAARPMVDGPLEAGQTGKPVVYIQANIHSGEVEGKEAAQMLLRDLTVGSLQPLLDSVIVLVVPIYNADGNEKFGPGAVNRPGQNGPDRVGPSTNGQGLNLNRDYVKQEAPETRGSLALIDRWQPDLFIDLHTTNGSYHGYALTWAPGLNPNSSPANDYTRDHFLPTVRDRLRRRQKIETFPYGNFRNQDPDSLVQGWETYDARPRFGTNNMGMRGRIAILSEGYSNNPFPERIRATYAFLREILSLAAEERSVVKRVIAEGAAWRPDSIGLHSIFAPPVRQDVVAEITRADGDGNHGFARRIRTGVFKTIRMPVYDRFVADRKVARPAAYLLPPQHAPLAALLRAEGIVVERLVEDWQGQGESFAVDSVQVAAFPFEGHRLVTLTGQWNTRPCQATAGWFYISTEQRGGVLAAYLLEPTSEDGFGSWNFYDREVRAGAQAPVLRVLAPLTVPRVMLE